MFLPAETTDNNSGMSLFMSVVFSGEITHLISGMLLIPGIQQYRYIIMSGVFTRKGGSILQVCH